MFGKNDFMDDLNRDLCRARDKRDALASHVTALTTQITELEARLFAETIGGSASTPWAKLN